MPAPRVITGIVSAKTGALEGARTGIMRLLSKAHSMSLGHKRPNEAIVFESASPPNADISVRRIKWRNWPDNRALFHVPGDRCSFIRELPAEHADVS